MAHRHKMQRKASGGNIRMAETEAAKSKSDAFKSGGKAGKSCKAAGGPAGMARLDKPSRRASGGALSSAAKTSTRKDGGAGSGHESAEVGSGPGEN